MSGIQPSAHDSGIVENVLGIGIGLVMVGVGIYAWLTQSETLIVLFSGGIGLVIVVGAAIQTRKTVQDLVEAGVTDPVEVLRADLNDRDEIIRGHLKVVLFWVVVGGFWAFAITTPDEVTQMLQEVATNRPELIAGWVVLNAVLVIAILFRSYRTRRNPRP